MQLTAEQKRAYHTDGICRIIEIKEHLIKTDNRQAFLKHAPFKTLGTSEQWPSETFADAYVKAIESGDLEPIVFGEEYNDMVKRKEHQAEVRRLQGDSVVMNANKPFKRKSDAEKFQEKYDLKITHYIKEVEHGFVMYQNTPSMQKELSDKAQGLKTYSELQAQAFQELSIPYVEKDGELDATEDQWVMIDARVNELQRLQRGMTPLSA